MNAIIRRGAENVSLASIVATVLAWGLGGLVPFAQAAEQPDPLTTVQEEQGMGIAEGTGNVQERGLSQLAVAPPYACDPQAGVCLCVGQTNCEQMARPTPCTRQKFCTGQPVAQQPPPLPPQEIPQGMARTSEGTLVICSCQSGH